MMKKLAIVSLIVILVSFSYSTDEDAKRDGYYHPTQLQESKTTGKIRRVKCREDGIQLFQVIDSTVSVVDHRYTVKPSTATIKRFIISSEYTSPYPINSFSIVCFGEGATISSNVGDITNIPFIDGFGVKLQLDQPKYNAHFKFELLPNTTVYLALR